MPKTRKPRKGSLQYWPRKRARRIYPKINSWVKLDKTKLLGFIGYKAGMTHLLLNDNKPTSPTQGQEIFCPVTIIECPPIKIFSLRFYKKTSDGLKLVSEILSEKLDKELARKIKFPKKQPKKIPEEFDDLRILVYTQPKLTNIGKKKPELIELAISGDPKTKLEHAKKLLEKEIKISDIFEKGQFLDIHAITKGKGFQGPVKRFGIKIRQHKSEKTKRGPGSLGAWTPKKVSWRVPHAGQMGYHTRTEYNKWVLKISTNPTEINKKGGFLHYGFVKNDYLLIKGSISGPAKRTIILTEPIRLTRQQKPISPEIRYVSLK